MTADRTENQAPDQTGDGARGADRGLAAEAEHLLRTLFPICRSLTGDGVRATLRQLQALAPFELEHYPSGGAVYDWTIPDEWVIRDAYIADADGRRLVDFRDNNLHVVSYSRPVQARMTLAQLAPHLFSLPELPDAIPYRTTYYKQDWGFCLSQRQRDRLDPDALYSVVIDSELRPGALSLAVARLSGTEAGAGEYLISTYCCHPSMANDNLSGVVVTALLCRALAGRRLRHSYRVLVAPETIGAIAYLAHHPAEMAALRGGLVVTTCAGPGRFGYKETFLGNHLIDRVIRLVFRDAGIDPLRYRFVPDGSDERQYSSPGFRIPVASLTKDKYYEYEYYHTSLDNLDFVSGDNLARSVELHLAVIETLEQNRVWRSCNPCGEAQLGRRGLYPQTGGALRQPAHSGADDQADQTDLIAWIMFLADGDHDLVSIAERSGHRFSDLARVAALLERHGLIEPATAAGTAAAVGAAGVGAG